MWANNIIECFVLLHIFCLNMRLNTAKLITSYGYIAKTILIVYQFQ